MSQDPLKHQNVAAVNHEMAGERVPQERGERDLDHERASCAERRRGHKKYRQAEGACWHSWFDRVCAVTALKTAGVLSKELLVLLSWSLLADASRAGANPCLPKVPASLPMLPDSPAQATPACDCVKITWVKVTKFLTIPPRRSIPPGGSRR